MAPRRGVPRRNQAAAGGAVADENALAIGSRIRELRLAKVPAWTQTRLAEEASKYSERPITQQNINKYENGVTKRPKFLDEIAKALHVDIEDITGRRGFGGKMIPPDRMKGARSANAHGEAPTPMVPIIGSAADGFWAEPETLAPDDVESVPRFSGPRWSHAEQFAVRVRGPSVNRLHLPDGSIAICVPYQDGSLYPGRQDVALVILRKGSLEQWAIKTLIFRENRIELWASSTDQRYGKPLRFDVKNRVQVDDPEVSLEIKGLVIKGVTDIAVADVS